MKKNIIDFINEESIEIWNKNRIFDYGYDFKNDFENPISELQMHKLLYFLYGFFYKTFHKPLFENANFEAWKFGPVEIDYRKLLKSCENTTQKFNSDLSEKETKFLKTTLKKLLTFSISYLVDWSHKTDPWINNVEKNTQKISTKEIENYFIAKNV